MIHTITMPRIAPFLRNSRNPAKHSQSMGPLPHYLLMFWRVSNSCADSCKHDRLMSPPPGIYKLYIVLYSDGVHPLISLNILINELRELNPDESDTSVTDMEGLTSRRSAVSILF